jgi:hypothetical protein
LREQDVADPPGDDDPDQGEQPFPLIDPKAKKKAAKKAKTTKKKKSRKK